MENELNIEIVNKWLKDNYGMSYDDVCKEYNQAVDMFSEKCKRIKELREEIYKLEEEK